MDNWTPLTGITSYSDDPLYKLRRTLAKDLYNREINYVTCIRCNEEDIIDVAGFCPECAKIIKKGVISNESYQRIKKRKREF